MQYTNVPITSNTFGFIIYSTLEKSGSGRNILVAILKVDSVLGLTQYSLFHWNMNRVFSFLVSIFKLLLLLSISFFHFQIKHFLFAYPGIILYIIDFEGFYNPKNRFPRRISVWSAICRDGIFRSYSLKGTITGENYQALLRESAFFP